MSSSSEGIIRVSQTLHRAFLFYTFDPFHRGHRAFHALAPGITNKGHRDSNGARSYQGFPSQSVGFPPFAPTSPSSARLWTASSCASAFPPRAAGFAPLLGSKTGKHKECHASSNRCLTSSNKKVLESSALLLVTIRIKLKLLASCYYQ